MRQLRTGPIRPAGPAARPASTGPCWSSPAAGSSRPPNAQAPSSAAAARRQGPCARTGRRRPAQAVVSAAVGPAGGRAGPTLPATARRPRGRATAPARRGRTALPGQRLAHIRASRAPGARPVPAHVTATRPRPPPATARGSAPQLPGCVQASVFAAPSGMNSGVAPLVVRQLGARQREERNDEQDQHHEQRVERRGAQAAQAGQRRPAAASCTQQRPSTSSAGHIVQRNRPDMALQRDRRKRSNVVAQRKAGQEGIAAARISRRVPGSRDGKQDQQAEDRVAHGTPPVGATPVQQGTRWHPWRRPARDSATGPYGRARRGTDPEKGAVAPAWPRVDRRRGGGGIRLTARRNRFKQGVEQ